jgi:1,4-dihydroxy-2-naphthoate octaprenyltransferase
MQKHPQHIFGLMRAPFLILTPACVLVGLGTALWTKSHVNGWHFVLVLLGALAAHVSVNAFNEYFDFKTGLDAQTQRTPFSGGSGTLPEHPELARTALVLAWLSFAMTALIGLYFVLVQGWQLLPLGLAGLFLLYGYTAWLVYHPVACLLAPGLGFGPLMVMGTHFALTGEYSWTAFAASLVPFFLVSNLLLLNQFPDVEADRRVGRKHYPILIGRKRSSYLYLAFLLAAYLSVGISVWLHLLPPFSLLALITVVLALPLGRGVLSQAENLPALMPSLARNVLVNLTMPLLLAIGLMIG